jgi:hypothetical protein
MHALFPVKLKLLKLASCWRLSQAYIVTASLAAQYNGAIVLCVRARV